MFSRDRLCQLAVRGWLIAILVLLPCTSTAQQETEKPPTALEQSQGTAVEAPAPQSETPKPSAQQEPPAVQPPPAAPVQNKRPAPPSCGPRCQATEQREKDDLKAQQSMAEFAFDLVVISWWQFGAGTIGITLLLTTLWYTRKSTRAAINAAEAAQKTVDVARETAERQLRAYVVYGGAIWTEYKHPDTGAVTGYGVTIIWRNSGVTPARRCRTWASCGDFRNGIPENFDFPDRLAGTIPVTEKSHIGPKGEARSIVGFSLDKVQAAQRGETKLIVWGWIEYDDIFENTPRRRTELCLQAVVGPDMKCSLAIIGPFNSADEDCHHQPRT